MKRDTLRIMETARHGALCLPCCAVAWRYNIKARGRSRDISMPIFIPDTKPSLAVLANSSKTEAKTNCKH